MRNMDVHRAYKKTRRFKMDLALCFSIKAVYANVDARPCSCLNQQSFLFNYAFPLPYVTSAVVLICGIFLLTDWYPYDRLNLMKTRLRAVLQTNTLATVFRVWQIFTSAVNTISMFWVLKWNYNGFSMGRKKLSQQRCKASHVWDINPFIHRFVRFVYVIF